MPPGQLTRDGPGCAPLPARARLPGLPGGGLLAGQFPQPGQIGLQLTGFLLQLQDPADAGQVQPVGAQVSASRSMSRREYRRVPPALRAWSSSPAIVRNGQMDLRASTTSAGRCARPCATAVVPIPPDLAR